MSTFIKGMGISLIIALLFALFAPEQWFIHQYLDANSGREMVSNYKPLTTAGMALFGIGVSIWLHFKEKNT